VPLDSGVRVVQFDFLFVQRGGGVNESSCGSRVFHLTLHRYREEILARGKDSGGRNSDLGKEIWIVVSVRLWFGLVMIVFGVSGASDCDERVPSLRVMI